MNYDTLVAEIRDDPLGQGYAGMDHAQVAAALNAKEQSRIVPISSAELLAWCGQANRLGRVEAAGADPALSPEIQTVAKVAMRLVERDATELDLAKPDRMAMLDALVAAGVLTAEEKDELSALATESISRADELGLPSGWVTPGRVESARQQMG